MKISFLLTQSLESPSGLGRHWPLAKELARLGHHVSILALHHDFQTLETRCFVDENVQVKYVGQMHVLKKGSRKYYFASGRLLKIVVLATLQLTRAAIQERADVYHVCKPHPMNGIAGWLASKLQNTPLFIDCDDYEAGSNRFSNRWQKQIVNWFEHWLPKKATTVTVNTRFLLHRHLDRGIQRVHFVSNGIDRERFKPPTSAILTNLKRQWDLDEKQVVIFVGSMSLISHPVDLLIDAFAIVRAQLDHAVLVMVGGGENYEDIQKQVNMAGLHDSVKFTGRVDPCQVPAFFALADLSVDPVHCDLTAQARSPLKIFESLATGTPVVTGDVGDRRHILLDGAVGKLVQPGNSEALGQGIVDLLIDNEHRQKMIKNTQTAIEPYYWDKLVHQFQKAYNL